MAIIQSYKQGYINKFGQEYQFIVKGKVEGTYATVQELVQGVSGGKQDKPSEDQEATTRDTADTQSSEEPKTELATEAPKKKRRRKAKKQVK